MNRFWCRLLNNYLEGLLAFSAAVVVGGGADVVVGVDVVVADVAAADIAPSLFAHESPDEDIVGAEDVADVGQVAEIDHVALHSGPCGNGYLLDGATLGACDIPCAHLVDRTDTVVLPLADEGGDIQRVQLPPMGA